MPLIALALAAAVADWIAVARGSKRLEYIFKPLTILLLVAAVPFVGADAPDRQQVAIAVALVFSVVGDVFLMLPHDLFVPGLASFLIAHLAYVLAFSPLPPAGKTWPLVVGVALISGTLLSIMVRSMLRRDMRALIGPVIAYVAAIGAMVTAALATLVGEWPMPAAAFAAAGAVLFMTSDALIGWNRFVKTLPWAPVAIIVTYHLGQTGLTLSLVR